MITDCQQFPVLIPQGKVSELPRRLGEEYKTVGGKEWAACRGTKRTKYYIYLLITEFEVHTLSYRQG